MRQPPSPPTPTQRKKIEKMIGKAIGKKVDPMDYVRPPRAGGKAIGKKPYPPKDSSPRRRGPAPAKPMPRAVIEKPYKGPKIKFDGDLRQIGPRKKPKPSKPRGNPNAKYRIVPAKKKK